MVDLAGLSDQVTVIVGAFADTYQALKGKTVDVRDAYHPAHSRSVSLARSTTWLAALSCDSCP